MRNRRHRSDQFRCRLFQLAAVVLLPDDLGSIKVVVHVPLHYAGLLGDFGNGVSVPLLHLKDALLQKTVTTDFLTKKRVENRGIVPQYYVEGSHEAIIPKELFMRVQEEMVRRANLETGTGKRRIYSGKYALSSIVFCAHCGDVFQRTHWDLRGRKVIVWRCISRLHKKKSQVDCSARTVKEYVLHAAVVQAVNEVYAQRDAYLPQLKANIEKVLGEDNSGPVAEVDAKIADLQQELLKKAKANQDYEMLGKEITRLREEKYQLQLEDANREGVRQKVADLETFFGELDGEVTEYDDSLVRRLIERITVYDDHFTVEFKSGIEVDVDL